MTPEERLNRIEQALDRHISFVGHSLEQQNQQIAKNTDGIRDLIVVSRTVLTSIDGMRQAHEKDYDEMRKGQEEFRKEQQDSRKAQEDLREEDEKLRKLHADTAEKLNILLNIVDRIIRRNDDKPPEE